MAFCGSGLKREDEGQLLHSKGKGELSGLCVAIQHGQMSIVAQILGTAFVTRWNRSPKERCTKINHPITAISTEMPTTRWRLEMHVCCATTHVDALLAFMSMQFCKLRLMSYVFSRKKQDTLC